MLAALGFPAVATASAAISYSLGYDDGERITFAAMRDAVARICAAVTVPVTADIERGYADDSDGVGDTVRRIIAVGAVGINIEDSTVEGGPLRPTEEQADRIRAARRAAGDAGVPLVINARTDVWLSGGERSGADRLREAVDRARAYIAAGADCIYPVTLDDLDALQTIRAETGARLNVYLTPATAPMAELEAAGVARLSVGPGLIKASLAAARRAAVMLQRDRSYEGILAEAMTGDEIASYVVKGPMPEDG